MLALHELGDVTPTFDLRIATRWRGHGCGRRVLPWLAQHVFTVRGKARIEGHTRADNVAMRRVFRACGWTKEAHYRRAWPDEEGVFHDATAYALLRSDWETGGTTPVPWEQEP